MIAESLITILNWGVNRFRAQQMSPQLYYGVVRLIIEYPNGIREQVKKIAPPSSLIQSWKGMPRLTVTGRENIHEHGQFCNERPEVPCL